MLKKREDRGELRQLSTYDRESDSLASSHPTVVDFLTQEAWPDGKRRLPGTIMLLYDAGLVKAWVHDKDGREAAWVSCDTLWGLLDAVEKGLKEDSLEWRKDKPMNGKKS